MESYKLNGLLFSNKNIELAYRVKKICWEYGINIINCESATMLVMNTCQIQPDIIFFDLTDNYCTQEFIMNFCNSGITYVPSIVIVGIKEFSYESNNLIICSDEKNLENTIINNIDKIKLTIINKKIIRYSEALISESILECLKPLAFNKRHKGYTYIKDIVRLFCLNDGVRLHLTTEVYPAVAAKNKVTSGSVERDIRTAIKHVWKFSTKENLYNYFGYYEFKRIPSNLQLITALVEKTLHYCLISKS